MADANGLPFLRFKKPQSVYLTRVFTDNVKRRQKWVSHMANLRDRAELGKDEDQWSKLVDSDLDKDGGSWAAEIHKSVKQYERMEKAHQVKIMETSKRMLSIVDQEKALAEQERKHRKMEKNRAKRERKKQKSENLGSGGEAKS